MKDIIINNQILKNISNIIVYNDLGEAITFIEESEIAPSITFDRVFANNTPAQIAMVSADIATNNYNAIQVAEIYGWNIGDTIPIILSSDEIIEMRILGFNHDTLSDGAGKAGLSLGMVNLFATSYQMNLESTNAGGYAMSQIKTNVLPALKDLLPQE